MKKGIIPIILLILTLAIIFPVRNAQTATKLTLSDKKIVLRVGTNKTVSANKAVKWTSSDKKIATVKKLTAKKAKLSAKKAGSCKIIATAGNKKAEIRITIKGVSKPKKTKTPENKPLDPVSASALTQTLNPASTSAMQSNEIISAKLVEKGENFFTISLDNKSEYDVYDDYDFSLQKLEDGKWVYVEPIEPIITPDAFWELPSGETRTQTLDMRNYNRPIPLEKGTYRIIKNMFIRDLNDERFNRKEVVTVYIVFENEL